MAGATTWRPYDLWEIRPCVLLRYFADSFVPSLECKRFHKIGLLFFHGWDTLLTHWIIKKSRDCNLKSWIAFCDTKITAQYFLIQYFLLKVCHNWQKINDKWILLWKDKKVFLKFLEMKMRFYMFIVSNFKWFTCILSDTNFNILKIKHYYNIWIILRNIWALVQLLKVCVCKLLV